MCGKCRQLVLFTYCMFLVNIYMIKPLIRRKKKRPNTEGSGFWMTVFKVEVADMAFAVDSILAAVALAVSLPATGLFSVGSLDGAQFIVIFAGGMIGVVIIRFAANFIVK